MISLSQSLESYSEETSSQASYDIVTHGKASQIVSGEWLKGLHHTVQEDVTIMGPHYRFTVISDFGKFTAQGVAMLRRLVREIHAISKLKEVSSSQSFLETLKEASITIPLVTLREMIINPADTVSGIPKGVMSIAKSSKDTLSKGRSEYEDRYLTAFLSVSKYKRLYSSELGIDVYTTNRQAQRELNRISWASAAGNWTPSIALFPFSGPIKKVFATLTWTDSFNRLITEEAPDLLRLHNDKELAEIGAPRDLRNKFLGHANYSPRHQTIIIGSLQRLKNAENRAKFIELALSATSELDAFTFQQIAEMLSSYNHLERKIVHIYGHMGFPIGVDDQGGSIWPLPIDIGRWTAFTEFLVSDFASQTSYSDGAKALWLLGKLTPLARKNLTNLGITYKEDVGGKIGLMD